MGFGLALIGRLKLWVYAAGAALVAIGLAYFKGRSAGAAAVKADANEARLDAMQTAKEVEDEIRSLDVDDPAFIDRASQWVRKSDDQ